jgi:hypothetical protein
MSRPTSLQRVTYRLPIDDPEYLHYLVSLMVAKVSDDLDCVSRIRDGRIDSINAQAISGMDAKAESHTQHHSNSYMNELAHFFSSDCLSRLRRLISIKTGSSPTLGGLIQPDPNRPVRWVQADSRRDGQRQPEPAVVQLHQESFSPLSVIANPIA